MTMLVNAEAVPLWYHHEDLSESIKKARASMLVSGHLSAAPFELTSALDESLGSNYSPDRQRDIISSGRALVALIEGQAIKGISYANGWRQRTGAPLNHVEVGFWSPEANIATTNLDQRLLDLRLQACALELLETLPSRDVGIVGDTTVASYHRNLTFPNGSYRYSDRHVFATIASHNWPSSDIRNSLEATHARLYPQGLLAVCMDVPSQPFQTAN